LRERQDREEDGGGGSRGCGSVVAVTAMPLADRLDEVLRAPADEGTVELLVRRPVPEEREVLEEAELDLEEGLVGDCWRARGTRRGPADPDAQVTLMSSRVAALVAGDDPERWALAGDQLYVDFDLGAESLPAGCRIAVGSAVLEITALPHTGCGKFTARFGSEATRLVNAKEHRALRLRGVNARVVEPGRVRRGDPVRRLA
jgi:MOSC domain-containing protein YiiM